MPVLCLEALESNIREDGMGTGAWMLAWTAVVSVAPAQEVDLVLTDAAADRFAALALKCAGQEYPKTKRLQNPRSSTPISAFLPLSFSQISVKPLPTA